MFVLEAQLASGFPCVDAVERQLAQWHATDEVLMAPGGPLGGHVYRIATEELGVWITMHQPRGLETTSLFLTSAERTLRLDFGRTCQLKTVELPRPPDPPDGAFTDVDLEHRLALDDRLVIYLWSPHLPLSVEGYAEIARAASALGVPLVAVVDASADSDFVRRVAEEHDIPAEAERPMRSVELLFRDLTVHTPSIVVFHDGIVSSPLPGYRNSDAYLEHLKPIFRGK